MKDDDDFPTFRRMMLGSMGVAIFNVLLFIVAIAGAAYAIKWIMGW